MKHSGELGISKAFGESALFCRYTCESCGYDSQWRKVDVIKLFLDMKTELRPRFAGQYFETEEEAVAAYYDAAKAKLPLAFARVEGLANQGYFEQLLFREKGCPHCGAKQSWMLPPSKRPGELHPPRLWANPTVDGHVMLSDFIDPDAQERLSRPCQVQVQRLPSFLSSLEGISVALNGLPVGGLLSGGSLTAQTEFRHNILALHSVSGGPVLAAIRFEAEPGGQILRRFSGTKFKPD